MENEYLEPESSSLFEAWTDPESGVLSYVLTDDTAPRQQSFYFTNCNLAANGRYLWFYASYPPSPSHVLGVVDLQLETVQVYPETAFDAEAPWIDPDTATAYWAKRQDIYRREPRPDATVERVCHVPEEIVGGQDIQHISTHLTRSADDTMINLDIRTVTEFHIAAVTIETGEIAFWYSSDRCYKHSQFNPTAPDVLMFCQDWWTDLQTGKYNDYENRIWLQHEGEDPYPLFSEMEGCHSHEWWAADGQGVWYVDYESGTHYYDLETQQDSLVWPKGTCHSHASSDDQMIVGDINTYSWNDERCHIRFYDRGTETGVDIVSDLPEPPNSSNKSTSYHIHPHPQFILNDEFVVYTTTVRGSVEVAVTPVSELRNQTR